MRKIKMLTFMLILVMLLSTVVACGSNTSQGENETSSEATTQSTKEETKAPETTTAAESTTQESSTSGGVVNYYKGEIKYTKYPMSDETKAMLIEKLTNLELVRGQKFDMNSLNFKEVEMEAYHFLKSMLAYVMNSELNDTSILTCYLTKLEIYRIDNKDDCMTLYFKKVSKS